MVTCMWVSRYTQHKNQSQYYSNLSVNSFRKNFAFTHVSVFAIINLCLSTKLLALKSIYMHVVAQANIWSVSAVCIGGIPCVGFTHFVSDRSHVCTGDSHLYTITCM